MKFPEWLPVYGDTKYRDKNCPSETAEQITFFNQIRKLEPTALHPRNEGKRSYNQAARQKAEGMTPGAADIVIPGCPSFVCELKKKDHTKSRWQPNQIEFLEECHKNGAFVCAALGWQGAMEAYKAWKSL